MEVLQQKQLLLQTAQDQPAAAAGQASTAQLQPELLLFEERCDDADLALSARDAALSQIPREQLMMLSGTACIIRLADANMCPLES